MHSPLTTVEVPLAERSYLIEIGTGEAEPEWARTVLEARDRTAGGVTAPPGGLYLVRVSYPERFGLP